MAWAGTRFVAVGDFGTVATSSDGGEWKTSWSGIRSRLYGVAWADPGDGGGPGLLIAIGDDATILTSEDGKSWTLRNRGIVQLRGVAWTGDGFLAAGKYGYVRMSRDGIAWDSAYVGNDEDYFAVAWSPAGRAAIVGNAGSIASTDGAGRWSVRSVGIRKTLRSVATDGRGRYLAVGDDGAVLRWRGTAFAPESLGTLNGFRSAVWAGPRGGDAGTGRWVAAGWLGVHRSDDGVRWEALGGQAYDPRFDFHSLVWMDSVGTAGGTLVAVGQGGVIQTSPDGSTWILRDSGRAAELRSAAWSGNRLVAVGTGAILVSDDAKTWSQAHPGPGYTLNHVAAGAGQFLAVGAGGGIFTSPDGLAWTARISGTGQALHGATWTGRQWIVIGESGLVLRSADGVDWRPAGHMGGSTLRAVIWTGTGIGPEEHKLLAVGDDGAILSAREDQTAGIRRGVQAGSFLASTSEGLRIRFPEFLRGKPVRLSVHGAAGARRLHVQGAYPGIAVLPLSGLPAGRYVLEIRGEGRRFAETFQVGR